MQIKKLTLTPLAKGYNATVIEKPSTQRAGILIKEKLCAKSLDYQKPAKIFRRIPKALKGIINPETKVPNEQNFSIYS